MNRISPAVLLIVAVLAVVFFISGLIHLLARLIMKRLSFSSAVSNSDPNHMEAVSSRGFRRQLQQLFHLHDSGLDQTHIDALPVFYYKDIIGSKEPFDCAVCLCEFTDKDKLRLIPFCSHAFHIACIDTWLLSNSTCPLCRGTIVSSGYLPIENPLFNNLYEQYDHTNNGIVQETRVLSVRLGKFVCLNEAEEIEEQKRIGESSNTTTTTTGCSLDERRCYSMGSVQYVFGDLELQVLSSSKLSSDLKLNTEGCNNGRKDTIVDGRIGSNRTKGESFSSSKIWLWSSKKNRSPSNNILSSDSTNVVVNSLKTSLSFPVGTPLV